jgi:adenylate cyclase
VLTSKNVSRRHALLSLRNRELFVRDLDSKFGTYKNGVRLTEETAIAPGDKLGLGDFSLHLQERSQVSLSADHTTTGVMVRPVERVGGEEVIAEPSVGAARLMTLLSEIGKTLVDVHSLEGILDKIVALTFESVPAERAFLLLRGRTAELTPQVAVTRAGEKLVGARISRTVVERVQREGIAMLASDTTVDPRLSEAMSVRSLSVRSFMCVPLWNRNEVIGVIYVDNPVTKQFSPADLDVFTALSNYVAVAIEQARLADELLEETKRRERLQRYHSPGVVSRILQGAESADGNIAAQAQDLSVMFADIVGFTSLTHQMPPRDVVALLGNFFELATDIIFEHDGTLDKFIGDCVMAVFGAPFEQPDHARRADETARAIRRALVVFNDKIAPVVLRLRIAINSGEAMMGDVGSSKRREFTVLGDVVNVAARLERYAQPGQTVLTRNTLERAGPGFSTSSLGRVQLRGPGEEVEVFELID